MLKLRMFVAVAGSAAVVASMAVASSAADAAARPADAVLAGSAAPFASGPLAAGDVAAATGLTVQVWLKPSGAAAGYATSVSTPGNALYGHYLSPAAYTARFGASARTVDAVESWLRGKGFTGITTDSQRNYVRASAPVSKVDAAFRITMKYYRPSAGVNAGPYRLRANDRAVTLPTSLAGSVLGITGLSNAAPLLPLQLSGKVGTGSAPPPPLPPCSHYYGQHEATGLPEHFGTTTFPTQGCGYNAGQIRAAYGASPAATGTGQTIALVELGLAKDMFGTLKDYAARNAMPAPSPERYSELSLGQGTACGDAFAVEEQLDVEMSYDMAPGANQLVVGGDSCAADFGLQGLFDADTTILNGAGGHPLATVASNSWESGPEGQPAAFTNIEHAYLVRAAAEGVGMYFSSGDGSGVGAPSDDPDAIAVGGTTLGLSQTGSRLFETGWSTGAYGVEKAKWVILGEDGAAGGGPSLPWKQPAYQRGVVPASMSTAAGNTGLRYRSVPDISAEADLFTGVAVGIIGGVPLGPDAAKPAKYHQIVVGGTSVAAPLVAGMVTAAQQGQSRAFGFTNPAFYKLAGTSAFNDVLPLSSSTPALYRAMTDQGFLLAVFDDQSLGLPGYTGQVTAKGYDSMTGVGTPNGPAFIAALRKLAG